MSWLSKTLTKAANAAGDLFNRATGQTQANQWQWDMWNAQNEYNTPAAQRERLEAAGYNPLLMNNMGSSASGEASSMTAKSGSGVSPFEALSAIVNARTGIAQANLIQAQADQIDHDNNLVAGTPIASRDNSMMAKFGRAVKWLFSTDGNSVTDKVKSAVSDVGKSDKSFVGARIPSPKPGKRLDLEFDLWNKRMKQIEKKKMSKVMDEIMGL